MTLPLMAVLTACLSPLLALAEPQMLPREWDSPIPLRTVAVLTADTDAAALLESALKQAGASVEVISPDAALTDNGLHWKPEVAHRTVVVLGGIHTNRAMLPLYAGYLSFGDAAYPGGDGYVIRTITRPFGPGTAAIALEASTPEGEAAAVARFIELLGETQGGEFPPTIEAHLSDERLKAASGLGDRGMRYVLTGKPEYGQQGIRNLLKAMAPETGFLRYGDYGIERYVWEYNHLQDAPAIAQEDWLKLDQAMLLTALHAAKQWWRRKDGSIIGGRHQTMGTSCFTAAVHLLRRRGNPNEEAHKLLEQWWAESRAYWNNACSTFHDDLEGIPSYYCPQPTLDWALIMGFDDHVKRQLPLASLRAYAVVDSLGYYAGTGTYEECRPGDVFKPVPWGWLLRATNYFHPNEGYDWLQENMPHCGLGTWGIARSFAGARAFGTPDESEPPKRLLGVVSVPLGPHRYDQLSHDREQARASNQRYIAAPPDRCFEKLCFRDSFDPDGQYFVLEGYQTPRADNQPPMDANSIIRYTDLGHIWLHANTEKQGNLFRSAVFCADGMNDSPQPAGCELLALHNGPKIGLAASHFPDYVACDWTRNVIWRRGKYFVIIDLIRQSREGKFGLICTFRTPQRAWLTPDGMIAREGAAQMRICNADPVRLAIEGGRELEGAAVPTLLRETQLLDGDTGTTKAFRNLVYASDRGNPGALEIRPLGQTAAMIRGSARGAEELALVAAAPPGDELRLGPVETDARVLYIGTGGWAQAGGTHVKVAGDQLEGAEGDTPARLMSVLQKLWEQTKPAVRPRIATGREARGARLWRCTAFSPLPAAAPAPVLTCEPQAQGMLGSLFDGVVTRWATVRWPAGEVRLTVDLSESQPIEQIDFQTGVFGPRNVIPDPAGYPQPRTVPAEFSDDNFQQDIRHKTLTFTGDCTFEGLHKGSVYPILRWTCREVAQRARHVRLVFGKEQWKGALGMNELSVRPAGPNSARIIGFVQRDVDDDGADEILAWSDQAELVVVRSDGALAMRKQFPGYITSAECYPDLSPDGARILVTTREARLYCLEPDGAEVWATDFLQSAKLNGDLPTGYSIGLLKRPDGSPLIVVGNYNLASFVSPQGKVLKYQRLPAAYQTMTLPRGFDYDGDGKQDIVSTEVWGCLSVLDTDMRRRAGARLPRGKGIMLQYWQPPTAEQARAVVCTENGVGLLDLKTLKYDWLRNIKPISDCLIADLNGDGTQEVILAKQDGYILVYDDSGDMTHSELVGEPISAIAAVPMPHGKCVLAGALPGRIVRFDLATGRHAIVAVGGCSRLASAGSEGVLLAFGDGATIEAFDLTRPQ